MSFSNGNTPLNIAASNEQPEIVEYLANKGANVNAMSTDHWCPLHNAAANGDIQIVRLLIAHKVDINLKNNDVSIYIYFIYFYIQFPSLFSFLFLNCFLWLYSTSLGCSIWKY